MINRIGDWGLAVGIFLIFLYTGSVDFFTVFTILPCLSDEIVAFWGYNLSILDVIAFFLFFGVVGKSAQFGLHT